MKECHPVTYFGFEPSALSELRLEFGFEPPQLFIEWFAVINNVFSADVTPRRQDVSLVCADSLNCGAPTEPTNIRVRAGLRLSTPGVVGARNAPNVRVAQLSVRAINQGAQRSRIDE